MGIEYIIILGAAGLALMVPLSIMFFKAVKFIAKKISIKLNAERKEAETPSVEHVRDMINSKRKRLRMKKSKSWSFFNRTLISWNESRHYSFSDSSDSSSPSPPRPSKLERPVSR